MINYLNNFSKSGYELTFQNYIFDKLDFWKIDYVKVNSDYVINKRPIYFSTIIYDTQIQQNMLLDELKIFADNLLNKIYHEFTIEFNDPKFEKNVIIFNSFCPELYLIAETEPPINRRLVFKTYYDIVSKNDNKVKPPRTREI